MSKTLLMKKDKKHFYLSRILKITSKKCRNISIIVRTAYFSLVKPVSNFSCWSVHTSFLESILKLYQIYKLSQKQGDNEVDKKYGNKLHSKRKKLS